ncbi:30S ribosomal protein S7, partial [Candidatus Daviesbacteria bacterium]|nr:30S ribosomal protein S7 [Candidatus Daviesbacteria bacterium]
MRSKKSVKRILPPDPVYNSGLVSRFINKLMISGKKTVARKHFYSAMEQIKDDPLAVFEKAIQNVSPKMEVRPRRVGGASYQVPVEVRGDRKEALAIKWIIQAARGRSNKEFHSFDKKLAQELQEAANN